MNKFFAIAAATLVVAAPLTASADEAVRLETEKSSQFASGIPALAIGATVVIAGIIYAVVADDSSSSSTSTSTTMVAVGPARN